MARYLIIGNGVAGVRAAETLRKRDVGGEITIIGDDADGFYYRPQLADFVAGAAGPQALEARPQQFYASHDIELMLGREVTSIAPAEHRVRLNDGAELAYDRLLIATGASPRRAAVTGADLAGVHYLQTLSDARALAVAANTAQQAVIVGENAIGLEIARALLARGVKVSYLLRGERFWPEMLDDDAGEIVTQILEGRGIKLWRGEELRLLQGSGKVEKVVTATGKEIPADIVGLSLGLAPNVAVARTAKLDIDDGLLVDDSLATSAKDVYAAGDVTQAPELTSGGRAPSFGWLKAWRQGLAAGENMAGGSASVADHIRALQVQILDVDFIALGQSNPAPAGSLLKETAVFPDVGVYKSLVRQGDTLVGASFLGNVAEAGIIERLIRQRAGITQLDPAVHKQMFDEFSMRSVVVGVLCPVCKLAVPLEAGAKEGDVITCPVCGVDLRLHRMPNGLLGGRVG